MKAKLEEELEGKLRALTNRLLLTTQEEVSRLTDHPALFPSEGAGLRCAEYYQYVLRKYDQDIEKHKHQAKREKLYEEHAQLAKDENDVLESINRPSFKPDLQPWEQFLLKGSPGSGVQLPEAPPNGIVRVMPIGGVALYLKWLKDAHQTHRNLQDVVTLPLLFPCQTNWISQEISAGSCAVPVVSVKIPVGGNGN
jgi:hypothetical protein